MASYRIEKNAQYNSNEIYFESKAAVHSWCAGIKPIPQVRRELLAERLGILI